jgi:hypothetical protein
MIHDVGGSRRVREWGRRSVNRSSVNHDEIADGVVPPSGSLDPDASRLSPFAEATRAAFENLQWERKGYSDDVPEALRWNGGTRDAPRLGQPGNRVDWGSGVEGWADGLIEDLVGVRRIGAVAVEPGDVIVVELDSNVSALSAARIKAAVMGSFPGHEVCLLVGRLKLYRSVEP